MWTNDIVKEEEETTLGSEEEEEGDDEESDEEEEEEEEKEGAVENPKVHGISWFWLCTMWVFRLHGMGKSGYKVMNPCHSNQFCLE